MSILRRSLTSMDERSHRLIQQATALHQDLDVQDLIGSASRGQPQAIAAFVAHVLQTHRGQPLPAHSAQLATATAQLDTLRDGMAFAGAALSCPAGPLAMGLVFAAIRAQMLFLTPALMDSQTPAGVDFGAAGRRCRSYIGRGGGTLATLKTALPIALTELLIRVQDRDPVKAFGIRAIAMVLWYEELRTSPLTTTKRPKGLFRSLETAGNRPLYIREASCDMGLGLTVLFASDLHLMDRARSWNLVDAIVEAANGVDLVLLGGDLIDFFSGARVLQSLVSRLPATIAIDGNHDWWGLGISARAVRRAGGLSLTKTTHFQGLTIDAHPTTSADNTSNRILLHHYPSVFPKAVACGYPLTLTGHLHGGQVVWFEGQRAWPASIWEPWTGASFEQDGCKMLVSRGASDTIPIRFQCPRDVIRITL